MLLDLRLGETARFGSHFSSLRSELSSAIVEGQADGGLRSDVDPGLAAALLIGAMDGVLLQYFVDPTPFADRDAVAATLIDAASGVLAP